MMEVKQSHAPFPAWPGARQAKPSRLDNNGDNWEEVVGYIYTICIYFALLFQKKCHHSRLYTQKKHTKWISFLSKISILFWKIDVTDKRPLQKTTVRICIREIMVVEVVVVVTVVAKSYTEKEESENGREREWEKERKNGDPTQMLSMQSRPLLLRSWSLTNSSSMSSALLVQIRLSIFARITENSRPCFFFFRWRRK